AIAYIQQVIDAGLSNERDGRADDVGLGRRRCLRHGRAPMLRWHEGFMKLRAMQGWLPLVGALIIIGLAFDVMTRSRLSATPETQCLGEYADTLQIQTPHTREIEQ